MTPRQAWDQAYQAEQRIPHRKAWLRRRAIFAHALGILLPDVDFEVAAAGYNGHNNRPEIHVTFPNAAYRNFLPSHYPGAEYMAFELETLVNFYRSKIMTPAEQHNANVATAKIAIENALEVVKKARAFSGQQSSLSGVPYAALSSAADAQKAIHQALELIQKAEVPVYDKAGEGDLCIRIAFAKPGSDERYELAKQLVAHMAGRPKK